MSALPLLLDKVISPTLPWPRRFAFGFGHVMNDLVVTMWVTYGLVFFLSVSLFSTSQAGYLFLIGQMMEAFSCPLVGYGMDKMDGLCGYTKRKSWHLLGVVCCTFSFPFLFIECLFCSEAPSAGTKFGYYIPFILLGCFGWSCAQVSHLSLISDLTPCENEQVLLNSMRYAFTVLSNLTVYGITWFVLSTGSESSDITPQDAPQFRTLILLVVGGGIVFSILFHIGTHEPCCKQAVNKDHASINTTKMTWLKWLKETQFYQISFLYMFTRLAEKVARAYIPMYLTHTLKLHRWSIAIVPLVVYISSFLATFPMRCVNKRFGKKVTYLVGALLIVGSSVWMYLLKERTHYLVFGPAAMLGIGCTISHVTSLSIVADLIGRHTTSGAFVYGAIGLPDKLFSGIVISLIQYLHPCSSNTCDASSWYYRNIILYIISGASLCAILVLLTLIPFTIGKLKADKDTTNLTTATSVSDNKAFMQDWD